MKRKLALVLAAVMGLSMLPFNAFAASTNSLGATYDSLAAGTMLYEATLTAAPTTGGDVEEVVRGSNLSVQPKDASTSGAKGTAFEIRLTNADWFFRAPAGSQKVTAAMVTAAGSGYAGITSGMFGSAANSGNVTAKSTEDYVTTGTANYDSAGAYFVPVGSSTELKGFDGVYVRTTGNAISSAKAEDILYFMGIRGNVATLVFAQDALDKKVQIPLVVLTDEEDQPVTVQIVDRTAGVNRATLQLSAGVSGGTTAAFESTTVVGRDDVKLDMLRITETRTGTIGNGFFAIDAPTGYEFVGVGTSKHSYSGSSFTANVFGLGSATIEVAGFTANGQKNTATPPVAIGTTSRYESSSRRLWFEIYGATQSTNIPAVIELDGLLIEPISDNTWGDITGLKVVNGSGTGGGGKAGVSNYTFTGKIGERLDWGVQLLASDETEGVPVLFSGVFNTTDTDGTVAGNAAVAAEAIGGIEEDTFKIMGVRVQENTVNSWWTNRTTTVSLPTGVKVVGFEVTDSSNVVDFTTDTADISDMKLEETSSGDGTIEFDNNEIIFGDIKADPAKKTWIELDIWVSISPSMNGKDIELSIAGGGMRDAELPAPLKVATVKAPVTVETKLTNVAVGRSSQPTADIIIKETEAGALKQDKEILVQLIDEFGVTLGSDLRFNGGTIEVTAGDIEIDDDFTAEFNANAYGMTDNYTTPMFSAAVDIESTVASTITISNVRVQTSTRLPMNEKNAYQIVVFGTAIAENFKAKASSTEKDQGWYSDTVADAGILIDYVRTGSATVPGGFDSSAEFVLSLAESWYTINGERFEIPSDLMPKTVEAAGGSVTLVSTRLVSEAFGCEIVWDPNRKTATITLAPNRNVVFTQDSPYYTNANGVEVLMLYDDKVSVAKAQMIDNRLYVPFRFMGHCLDIADADISAADGNVYYNRAE